MVYLVPVFAESGQPSAVQARSTFHLLPSNDRLNQVQIFQKS